MSESRRVCRAAARALLAAALFSATPAFAGRVRVVMDPAVELVGAVQLLGADAHPYAGLSYPSDKGEDYIQSALRDFGGLRSHPAVALTARLDSKGFDFISRGQFLVRLSPPPELGERAVVSDAILQQGGGRGQVDGWLAALRDFAHKSQFSDFYAAQEKALAGSVADLQELIDQHDYVGLLERYSGIPFQGTYTVVASPYYQPALAVNGVFPEDDGTYSIYSLVGPSATRDGLPEYRGVEGLPGSLWHELSHGDIDALSLIHGDEIARDEPLFKRLKFPCYNEWNQCVKEHLVRAVKIRLIAREFGDEAGGEDLADEEKRGFAYLRPLVERLREYESDRRRYPTLADFYPRWISVLDDIMKAQGLTPSPPPRLSRQKDWLSVSTERFYSQGLRRRAIALLNLTLNARPQPRFLKMRGMLFEASGRHAQAAADADAALKEGPDPEALLLKGLALEGLGRRSDSQAAVAEAARLCAALQGPAPAVCSDQRLSRRGEQPKEEPPPRDAAEARMRIARLNQQLAAKPDPRALFERGMLDYFIGDLKAAVGDFDASLAARPGDARVLLSRGVVLQTLGRADDAAASYGAALAAAPEADAELTAEILSSRAALWHDAHDAARERADLRKALDVAPPHWHRRAETQRSLARLSGVERSSGSVDGTLGKAQP